MKEMRGLEQLTNVLKLTFNAVSVLQMNRYLLAVFFIYNAHNDKQANYLNFFII